MRYPVGSPTWFTPVKRDKAVQIPDNKHTLTSELLHNLPCKIPSFSQKITKCINIKNIFLPLKDTENCRMPEAQTKNLPETEQFDSNPEKGISIWVLMGVGMESNHQIFELMMNVEQG